MLCPRCQRPLTPLFTSLACDHCDGLDEVEYEHGFVVLLEDATFPTGPTYVFRTRTDAARWRAAQGLQQLPIREVLSEVPLRWRKSTGTIPDLELADRPFTIHEDHRFPPEDHSAFLAPSHRSAA